ncbi:MAG TPA: GvpL/GvpF family gas vesicle protein [Gemmatimonadaceae bacterium]|nr:GvpL/GvpF family gas vesicle protein [Gemmatimonadaceae bacterium]
MPTHLYCLIPATSHRPELVPSAGLDDAPVRALAAGAFVAWVSATELGTIPRDAGAIQSIVRAHDRVIGGAIRAAITVVPALVTTPYPDDARCAEDAASRAPELERLAARVRDRVEMAILLTAPARPPEARPETPGAGPGRRYLEAARAGASTEEVDRALDAAVDSLSAALRGVTEGESRRRGVDHDSSATRHGGVIHAISHLVRRDTIRDYRHRVEIAALPVGIRAVVDGPRAAYSFAVFTPSGTNLAN